MKYTKGIKYYYGTNELKTLMVKKKKIKNHRFDISE